MGLVKLFTPKADPIVAWKTEAGLVTDLDFNFDNHSLSGIRLGDPVSLLWKLGPVDDKAAEAKGNHNYYSNGVQITAEKGKVVSFILFWNDKLQKQFLAFTGTCIYGGQKIGLRPGMAEPEITDLFGQPYWRDEDDDEIILFYEFRDIEWQIEIDRREGLTAIVILTPPLLQDEAQRQAYQVTAPWPPSAVK